MWKLKGYCVYCIPTISSSFTKLFSHCARATILKSITDCFPLLADLPFVRLTTTGIALIDSILRNIAVYWRSSRVFALA